VEKKWRVHRLRGETWERTCKGWAASAREENVSIKNLRDHHEYFIIVMKVGYE
jgi:hypothetical protein